MRDTKIIHGGLTFGELLASRRWCYVIPAGAGTERGYIPSIAIEGVPGHFPMAGDPEKLQAPWYWGKSYDEACRVAEHANERRKIGPREAAVIVASTMGRD